MFTSLEIRISEKIVPTRNRFIELIVYSLHSKSESSMGLLRESKFFVPSLTATKTMRGKLNELASRLVSPFLAIGVSFPFNLLLAGTFSDGKFRSVDSLFCGKVVSDKRASPILSRSMSTNGISHSPPYNRLLMMSLPGTLSSSKRRFMIQFGHSESDSSLWIHDPGLGNGFFPSVADC